MTLSVGSGHTFSVVDSLADASFPAIAVIALDTAGLVAHAAASSSDQVHAATGPIDTTGATLIVVGVCGDDTKTMVLSDSKGNTWAPIVNGSLGKVRMFACGQSTSAADDTDQNGGLFGAGPMTVAGTSVNVNSVVVTFQEQGGTDAAVASPFSVVDALAPVPVFADGIASGFAIAPTVATYTASWTAPTSANLADAVLAVFTPGATTGGGDLSGQGAVTVTSPTRIRVHLTSIPSSRGTGMGNPTRFFEIGNIAWGNAGFFTRNYYIEHETELIPAPIPDADQVLYSFAPGVTATITPE